MRRKLWLEIRPVFAVLLVFGIILTLIYTGVFSTSKVMAFNDESGFGAQIGSSYDTPEFLKEHSNGRIYSLKDAPNSYSSGFDVMVAFVWPCVVALLCMGGVLTERNDGTASFVLSLPPSRKSWLWQKAAMVSVTSLGLALLLCLLIFGLSFVLGVPGRAVWLIRQPFLLTLVAMPWIGVSLLIQAWTGGLFRDPSANVVFAAILTCVLASQAALNLPSPLMTFKWWLLATSMQVQPGSPISWGILAGMFVIGLASMGLAIRRFERMDF